MKCVEKFGVEIELTKEEAKKLDTLASALGMPSQKALQFAIENFLKTGCDVNFAAASIASRPLAFDRSLIRLEYGLNAFLFTVWAQPVRGLTLAMAFFQRKYYGPEWKGHKRIALKLSGLAGRLSGFFAKRSHIFGERMEMLERIEVFLLGSDRGGLEVGDDGGHFLTDAEAAQAVNEIYDEAYRVHGTVPFLLIGRKSLTRMMAFCKRGV